MEVGALLHRGDRQAPQCWRGRNIHSLILITQVLNYWTSSHGFLSQSFSSGLFRALNAICKFRQRGQIVSWVATSKTVPPWGGTGRGWRALRPEDGCKSTLLFRRRRKGGERQERWRRTGASWYSWAGGHYCQRQSSGQHQSWLWQKCKMKINTQKKIVLL